MAGCGGWSGGISPADDYCGVSALFRPWVCRKSPRELKPRSDRSAGLYGRFCGEVWAASAPGIPRASGLRAPTTTAKRTSSTYQARDQPRGTTNTRMRRLPPSWSMRVLVNAGQAAPVHLRLPWEPSRTG